MRTSTTVRTISEGSWGAVPYPRKRDHHVSTISAYKAAAADGREAELHHERANRFDKPTCVAGGPTSIPATFLRVRVADERAATGV
jgi:hypothetical protein